VPEGGLSSEYVPDIPWRSPGAHHTTANAGRIHSVFDDRGIERVVLRRGAVLPSLDACALYHSIDADRISARVNRSGIDDRRRELVVRVLVRQGSLREGGGGAVGRLPCLELVPVGGIACEDEGHAASHLVPGGPETHA